MLDITTELDQYIATALWSTNADHLDPEGTGAAGSLQDHYGPEDLAPEALASMREDLEAFLRNAPAIALDLWLSELGSGQLGHDFWLTRNRHGAGFWDRFGTGNGERYGRQLTELARPFGESYLYAGDDGRLYVS